MKSITYWVKALSGFLIMFLIMGIPAWLLEAGMLSDWSHGLQVILFAITALVSVGVAL